MRTYLPTSAHGPILVGEPYAQMQATIEAQAAEIAKYNELLFAVGNKYPNETRHETALRYIRAAENSANAMLPKGVRT